MTFALAALRQFLVRCIDRLNPKPNAAAVSQCRIGPQTHTQTWRRVAMTIELSKEARKEAIASIERYFRENMEEPIGNIAAGALLGFFLEEVGPTIYNRAVAEVQERLQARVSELDIEAHEEEFQYWSKHDRKARERK